MNLVLVAKILLFSERFFLFLERYVHRKNKQLLLPDFSLKDFLIKVRLKPTRSFK